MPTILKSFAFISLFAGTVLALQACTPKAQDTRADDKVSAESPAANKISRTVDYYKGTSTISLPNGQVVGKADMLIRRTLDPSKSQIEEYVIDMAPKKKQQQEFRVIMTVDGNKFQMNDTGKAFSGSGTLEGQPWQWTAWTSVATLPNKMIVESHDKLVDNNLVVDKSIKAPDGTIKIKMEESYSPITKELFEKEKKAALTPKAPADNTATEGS